jgi:hypothetical protein
LRADKTAFVGSEQQTALPGFEKAPPPSPAPVPSKPIFFTFLDNASRPMRFPNCLNSKERAPENSREALSRKRYPEEFKRFVQLLDSVTQITDGCAPCR